MFQIIKAFLFIINLFSLLFNDNFFITFIYLLSLSLPNLLLLAFLYHLPHVFEFFKVISWITVDVLFHTHNSQSIEVPSSRCLIINSPMQIPVFFLHTENVCQDQRFCCLDLIQFLTLINDVLKFDQWQICLILYLVFNVTSYQVEAVSQVFIFYL